MYVDYDPVVLAHARALLDSSEAGATEYIDADLRDTGTILSRAADLLDFTKPVAVTLMSILHAIPDADDPYAIVAMLLDAVPSGSYLAISQFGEELIPAEAREALLASTRRTSLQQYTGRTREQVKRFFDGTDLVEPGLVPGRGMAPGPGCPRRGQVGRAGARWAASADLRRRRVTESGTGSPYGSDPRIGRHHPPSGSKSAFAGVCVPDVLARLPVARPVPCGRRPSGAVTAGHRGEMPGRLRSHRHKTEQNAGHNAPARLLRVKNGDIRPR